MIEDIRKAIYTSAMPPRRLKVEEVGDKWTTGKFSRIRLKGKWLTKAGLLPNERVVVTSPKMGVIVIQQIPSE